MAQRLHVHVVDADCGRRASIARQLYGKSIHVEIYEDLAELIRRAPSLGTLLVHADQPRLDEAMLIETVSESVGYLPVAFYSAELAPEKIVSAIMGGAIGYIQWPSTPEQLLDKVMLAVRLGEEKAPLEKRKFAARQRVATLTRRERDVLMRVVEGDSNKEIAKRLGISPRTVEIHRGNMLSRLEARSTAEAVRIGLYAGLVE